MAKTGEERGEAKNSDRATFVTVLRNRNFRNLWIGQVVSQVGDYFAFLAIMVVISGFSEDSGTITGQVSGVMIALTLPRLLFGVLAGVFVDRWDRRRTMIVSDILRVVLTLGMIPAFMSKNLLLMYGLAFAMSTVGAFFNPAKGALIPKLVPTEHLMAANSLSQTSMMAANFVGPALAGTTFALVGNGNQWIAFVLDSLTFIISAMAIRSIVAPREALVAVNSSESASSQSAIAKVWDELRVGLRALFLSRVMATLALVFAVTMLGVGALNVLWVAFLKTNFGFDAGELGWRFAVIDIAFFAGMVIASIGVGNFLSHLTPKWFIVWGLGLGGLATVPLGYLPDYWGVVGLMFLVGLFIAPINTGTTTLMQVVVPNSQLGRVGGGIGTITDAASLGSMSMAGALGALIGIPMVFAIAGLMCMVGGLVAWIGLPPLTLKDKVEEDEAPVEIPMGMEKAANVA